jgi:hypothetical protein
VKNINRIIASVGLMMVGITIGMEFSSHSNLHVQAQVVAGCEEYYQKALQPEYSDEIVMRNATLYLACREHQR